MLLMPLKTIFTFGWLAAKRIAQDGMDISGWYALKLSATCSGTFARVPPLTGSITMTGFPCFVATS